MCPNDGINVEFWSGQGCTSRTLNIVFGQGASSEANCVSINSDPIYWEGQSFRSYEVSVLARAWTVQNRARAYILQRTLTQKTTSTVPLFRH